MKYIYNGKEIESATSEKISQYLIFYLWGEEFGIELSNVHEIYSLENVVHVTNAIRYIEGVINIRSNIIPVIDLRKRFRMPSKQCRNLPVITLKILDGLFGFVVDGVSAKMISSRNIIEPIPTAVAGIGSDYIEAIRKEGNRHLPVLNFTQILHEDFDAINTVLLLGKGIIFARNRNFVSRFKSDPKIEFARRIKTFHAVHN